MTRSSLGQTLVFCRQLSVVQSGMEAPHALDGSRIGSCIRRIVRLVTALGNRNTNVRLTIVPDGTIPASWSSIRCNLRQGGGSFELAQCPAPPTTGTRPELPADGYDASFGATNALDLTLRTAGVDPSKLLASSASGRLSSLSLGEYGHTIVSVPAGLMHAYGLDERTSAMLSAHVAMAGNLAEIVDTSLTLVAWDDEGSSSSGNKSLTWLVPEKELEQGVAELLAIAFAWRRIGATLRDGQHRELHMSKLAATSHLPSTATSVVASCKRMGTPYGAPDIEALAADDSACNATPASSAPAPPQRGTLVAVASVQDAILRARAAASSGKTVAPMLCLGHSGTSSIASSSAFRGWALLLPRFRAWITNPAPAPFALASSEVDASGKAMAWSPEGLWRATLPAWSAACACLVNPEAAPASVSGLAVPGCASLKSGDAAGWTLPLTASLSLHWPAMAPQQANLTQSSLVRLADGSIRLVHLCQAEGLSGGARRGGVTLSLKRALKSHICIRLRLGEAVSPPAEAVESLPVPATPSSQAFPPDAAAPAQLGEAVSLPAIVPPSLLLQSGDLCPPAPSVVQAPGMPPARPATIVSIVTKTPPNQTAAASPSASSPSPAAPPEQLPPYRDQSAARRGEGLALRAMPGAWACAAAIRSPSDASGLGLAALFRGVISACSTACSPIGMPGERDEDAPTKAAGRPVTDLERCLGAALRVHGVSVLGVTKPASSKAIAAAAPAVATLDTPPLLAQRPALPVAWSFAHRWPAAAASGLGENELKRGLSSAASKHILPKASDTLVIMGPSRCGASFVSTALLERITRPFSGTWGIAALLQAAAASPSLGSRLQRQWEAFPLAWTMPDGPSTFGSAASQLHRASGTDTPVSAATSSVGTQPLAASIRGPTAWDSADAPLAEDAAAAKRPKILPADGAEHTIVAPVLPVASLDSLNEGKGWNDPTSGTGLVVEGRRPRRRAAIESRRAVAEAAFGSEAAYDSDDDAHVPGSDEPDEDEDDDARQMHGTASRSAGKSNAAGNASSSSRLVGGALQASSSSSTPRRSGAAQGDSPAAESSSQGTAATRLVTIDKQGFVWKRTTQDAAAPPAAACAIAVAGVGAADWAAGWAGFGAELLHLLAVVARPSLSPQLLQAGLRHAGRAHASLAGSLGLRGGSGGGAVMRAVAAWSQLLGMLDLFRMSSAAHGALHREVQRMGADLVRAHAGASSGPDFAVGLVNPAVPKASAARQAAAQSLSEGAAAQDAAWLSNLPAATPASRISASVPQCRGVLVQRRAGGSVKVPALWSDVSSGTVFSTKAFPFVEGAIPRGKEGSTDKLLATVTRSGLFGVGSGTHFAQHLATEARRADPTPTAQGILQRARGLEGAADTRSAVKRERY